MDATGHIMHGGTIVDATIINAPSSTKNAEKKRDPEMHQTKKGNEWKFGMKCNVVVDAGSGLVHSITATSAYGEACSKRFLPDQGVSLHF